MTPASARLATAPSLPPAENPGPHEDPAHPRPRRPLAALPARSRAAANPSPHTEGSILDRVARRFVTGMLAPFAQGRLDLTLPDGSLHAFGDPHAAPLALAVHDPAFFRRCLLGGDIGFGESYVAGEWDTPDLPGVLSWFIRNAQACPEITTGRRLRLPRASDLFRVLNRAGHLLRANTRAGSRENVEAHYDLSNEFFALWLDPGMTYSSALFRSPSESLEEAQERKYDRLCRVAGLRPGDRVLEIGTGWGGFCVHAAKHHGVTVDSVTISRRQFEYASARIAREGLADRVRVHLRDYRDLEGQYDAVVSIEMLEAVGDAYLPEWFRKVESLLKPEGVLAVQYITFPDSRHADLRGSVDWIQKHIFPGSLLLSIGRIEETLRRTGTLQLHDLKDLGASYTRTLALWRDAFLDRRDEVRALGFDESFLRKWDYYLAYCQAAFATRNISVVQAVYTRPNNGRLAEVTGL